MSTAETLRVSEMFESIQGEGHSAGVASVFLRLAVCNLRCSWCDTKYTWDWSQYRYDTEVREMSVADVAARVAEIQNAHLVVTGGEPLLQQPALAALFSMLPVERYIEVETNGTLVPLSALAQRVNQWNVSPKLANSGDARERRIVFEALRALNGTGRAWLKLVVESDADLAEADALIADTGWSKKQVLFMPQASSREELARREPLVLRVANDRGVGVSPRLHVERWDGRRGV